MELKVGQIVQLWFKDRNPLGNGTLVKVLEIHDQWVQVTTGVSCWYEKHENLREVT